MNVKDINVSIEIDLSTLETGDQGEMFQELLEVTPDAELAKKFEAFASQELMELLKDHFMAHFDLIEPEEDDKGNPTTGASE